jgi:hypothetical protein
VDGIVVDVQFWIAPGHEEFKQHTARYLSNVAGVMSVFDGTVVVVVVFLSTLKSLKSSLHVMFFL